ncbi:hypothetical protein EON67_11650 [archaeon]|nr:MAG: hypothetical protein EON67_11650 [archaeon]
MHVCMRCRGRAHRQWAHCTGAAAHVPFSCEKISRHGRGAHFLCTSTPSVGRHVYTHTHTHTHAYNGWHAACTPCLDRWVSVSPRVYAPSSVLHPFQHHVSSHVCCATSALPHDDAPPPTYLTWLAWCTLPSTQPSFGRRVKCAAERWAHAVRGYIPTPAYPRGRTISRHRVAGVRNKSLYA